jgi:hypothetical protein
MIRIQKKGKHTERIETNEKIFAEGKEITLIDTTETTANSPWVRIILKEDNKEYICLYDKIEVEK